MKNTEKKSKINLRSRAFFLFNSIVNQIRAKETYIIG